MITIDSHLRLLMCEALPPTLKAPTLICLWVCVDVLVYVCVGIWVYRFMLVLCVVVYRYVLVYGRIGVSLVYGYMGVFWYMCGFVYWWGGNYSDMCVPTM